MFLQKIFNFKLGPIKWGCQEKPKLNLIIIIDPMATLVTTICKSLL